MGFGGFIGSSGSQGEPDPGKPSVTLNGKLRAGVVVQDTVTGGLLGGHPTGEPVGIYDLSKGQVDDGEDYGEAATRELREETGISLSPGDLTYLGRFPLRNGEIELFYVAMPVDVSSLHCDSIIDNPHTPERIGLPEMDGYMLLHRNDHRGYKWMGAIEGLIRAAAPKFPRLKKSVNSSRGSQSYIVIFRGEEGELDWVSCTASTASEAREFGRKRGPVQMVLTMQGVKDILSGRPVEYEGVDEALFEFVRQIHFSPREVSSSAGYSVGRGSASGQYSVVDNETGEVVSYQDSFEDAEEYVREANGSKPLRFPLSAIFRGYTQAKDYGYHGSVAEWMREMGVEVASSVDASSSRQLLVSTAVPATERSLQEYGEGDEGFKRLINTPLKDLPRYRFLLADGDFKQFENGTLAFLIYHTIKDGGFKSFFSVYGGKVAGFYAYQMKSDPKVITRIKAFSLMGEEGFNRALAKDLFELVSTNVMEYSIEWWAAPGNPANEYYNRILWWYGQDEAKIETGENGSRNFHYLIPAGSDKVRGGHRQPDKQSLAEGSGDKVSGENTPFVGPGSRQIPGIVIEKKEPGGSLNPSEVEDGYWEGELIDSATARELLEGNDNPNFYHRADHLEATKAQGGSEIVRAYASTLELRTKSEHFNKNKTYYRQWVLFKDFKTISRDKKIPFEDAVDYSLNFGDVHIRCSCPSHKFHGYAYMGDQLQYLYGLPREKRFPKVRNPQLQNTTCKHVHMALEEILGSKEKIIKMFSEYYKRLPSVPEDTMIAIPSPKAEGFEPAELEVTGTEFEETGDVDVVLPEKGVGEQEIEPEVISTEDPTSPGTVYVDTKLAEQQLPEGQRVKYAGDEDSGDETEDDYGYSVPVKTLPPEEVEALMDEIDKASVSPKSDDERFSTEWAWQSLGGFNGR